MWPAASGSWPNICRRPAEVAALGINFAKLNIAPLAWPANYAPAIIVVWMILEIALLVYYLRTKPERIVETGSVFLEDAPSSGAE